MCAVGTCGQNWCPQGAPLDGGGLGIGCPRCRVDSWRGKNLRACRGWPSGPLLCVAPHWSLSHSVAPPACPHRAPSQVPPRRQARGWVRGRGPSRPRVTWGGGVTWGWGRGRGRAGTRRGQSPRTGARWRRSGTPRRSRRLGRCSPTSTRPPWRWATGARGGRGSRPSSSSSSAAVRSAAPSPWPRGCATACASCAPSACGTQVAPAPPRGPAPRPPGPSEAPGTPDEPSTASASPPGPLSPADVQFLASVLPPDTDPAFFEYLRAVDCSDVTVRALPEGSLAFPGVSAGRAGQRARAERAGRRRADRSPGPPDPAAGALAAGGRAAPGGAAAGDAPPLPRRLRQVRPRPAEVDAGDPARYPGGPRGLPGGGSSGWGVVLPGEPNACPWAVESTPAPRLPPWGAVKGARGRGSVVTNNAGRLLHCPPPQPHRHQRCAAAPDRGSREAALGDGAAPSPGP